MKAFFLGLPAKLAAWLHQTLSEDNGNPSSMRFVLVAWHVVVGLIWTGLSIYKREIVHIDESVLALLTLLTGAKVGQKFGETKPADPAS